MLQTCIQHVFEGLSLNFQIINIGGDAKNFECLQAFRKAIGVRIKEETEILEGEVCSPGCEMSDNWADVLIQSILATAAELI